MHYSVHDGIPSKPGELVMFICPEPSAFMIYISVFPDLSDVNAIFAPSGDQTAA